MLTLLLLAGVGLLAGAMNAIAGGGSFVTFPALVLAGLPPVIANASSPAALFPGSIQSVLAFWNDFPAIQNGFGAIASFRLAILAPISIAGGLTGAILLLATPAYVFD